MIAYTLRGRAHEAGDGDDTIEKLSEHPSVRAAADSTESDTLATISLVTGLVAVIGFGVLAGLIFTMVQNNSGFASYDEALASWGADHATASSTTVLSGLTQLGSSLGAGILAVAVGLWSRRRSGSWDAAAYLGSVFVGHSVISNALKFFVDRERPLVEHLVGTASSSFPSTHAGTAAAMWAAMALVIGIGHSDLQRAALTAVAIGVAILVAASRVLLGVHWFTDVVAGLAIGWAWYVLVSTLFGGTRLDFGLPFRRIAERARS
jgi:undecaprenyl-diphosphatase